MFLHTLDARETFVRNAVKKTDELTKIVAERRKTEHGGRKLSDEKINLMKDHIKGFPVMESHYTREATNRKFLSSNLNIAKVYDIFLELHTDLDGLPKFGSYRKLFCENFNLGFHRPKKDQCSECNAFKNMTTEQQGENADKQKAHLANKEQARMMKAAYIDAAINGYTNGNIQCFTFDLQKVLQTPFGETGELYYYSKFAVYNFTCFDVARKQGDCFVWDETIAKRGASEVSSCMHKLVEEHCTKEKNELVFFADNCPGQNKNRYIIQMLSLLVRIFQNIKSVTLMFLERGHTQNKNDIIHSTVEQSQKGMTINHPWQWLTLITGACKSKPYIVHEMEQDDFNNFETSMDGAYNVLINSTVRRAEPSNGKPEEGIPIKWKEIRAVSFESDTPFQMQYKYDLVVPWQCANIGQEICKVSKSKTYHCVKYSSLYSSQ